MLCLAQAISTAGALSEGLVDATMLDEIERAGYAGTLGGSLRSSAPSRWRPRAGRPLPPRAPGGARSTSTSLAPRSRGPPA